MYVIISGNDHHTIIMAKTAHGKIVKEMKTNWRILLATVNIDLEKWDLIEPKNKQINLWAKSVLGNLNKIIVISDNDFGKIKMKFRKKGKFNDIV